MTHDFDRAYWEQHWADKRDDPAAVNPYLPRELSDLTPGTALDAGCGTGREAVWLADRGWQVTGADISTQALSVAAQHSTVTWVEADLTVWEPAAPFDLVVTSYAHPAMPQLAFYERIARWVAPGGTLLIVGHRHDAPGDHAHGGHAHSDHARGHHEQGHDSPQNDFAPPPETEMTIDGIAELFPAPTWRVVTADTHTRIVARDGGEVELRDVIVTVRRQS